jgi:hypothetical protein
MLETRAQAYLDLVNSVSEIATYSKLTQGKDAAHLARLIQSKTRVVIIGSDAVVTEVHRFFADHDRLLTDASFDAFTKVMSAMRSDLAGKNKIELNVLSEALFGKRET